MARFLVALGALCAAAAGASAFAHADGASSTLGAAAQVVPNSFILEVDASAATLAKRGLTPFAALSRTLAAVEHSGYSHTVRERFESIPDVFHGASIQVADGVSIEDLQKIEGVKHVWPIRKYQLPRDPVDSISDYTFQPVASSLVARSKITISASGQVSKKRASTIPPASAYRGSTFYPHVQTNINLLHNAGYLGQGVKIAVLDGGLDYTNPILGGCFGEGCHISFGYDFVGDDYDGDNSPTPSEDPFATCTTHGTHITGIIGALANEYGVVGAAPMATLGHYRVAGCNDFSADDIIVAAMLRALAEDVDVINISLGTPVGFLNNSVTQIIAEYLASRGVHVVASAGNDRTEGLFFSNAPAAGFSSTGVGATDVVNLPAYNALVAGRDPIPYTSPMPFALPGQYTLYFTSTSQTPANDACTALPSSTPDLTNRVVVVRRGGCDFTVKQKNVGAAGGRVVLIANTQGLLTIPQLNVGTSGLTAVASIRYEDGLKLLEYYNASPNGQILTFPSGPLVPNVRETVSGGTIAYYSNFGPTNDLYLYPSLVAPGTDIVSTVPGGLGIMRGTSQSAPLLAGAYALILAARRSENLTPTQLRGIFQNSAKFVPNAVGSSALETVMLQGAGEIDVNRAFAARTLFSPSAIQLNDTANYRQPQILTLENRNPYAVTYTFSASYAQNIVTYNDGASNQIIPSTVPNESNYKVVRTTFSPRELTIPAGATGTVSIRMVAPGFSPADVDRFPLFSGFVNVRGQSVINKRFQTFNVPYFGLGARMVDMPVLDTTDVALGPRLPFIAVGEDILAESAIVIARNDPAIIYFRLAAGTRRLSVDYVSASLDYDGTIPSVTNPTVRMSKLAKRATPALYADVPTVGALFRPDYFPPRDNLVRGPFGYSDYELSLNGTFTENGQTTTLPNGESYRVLIRALKITADPTLSSSYESWLSPPFSFSG
ncbi:uncharacterized protein JCM10292_000694 [Rhodotorula paludigena]|uniref:uncharacterized protein n=1 Tax=Rhodotorula paludigena TaxID=86838 RepID=UPI00317E5F97